MVFHLSAISVLLFTLQVPALQSIIYMWESSIPTSMRTDVFPATSIELLNVVSSNKNGTSLFYTNSDKSLENIILQLTTSQI